MQCARNNKMYFTISHAYDNQNAIAPRKTDVIESLQVSTQQSQTTIICLTVADILARVYVDQPDGCYTLQQLEYHHKGNNAWQTKTNSNAFKHVFDGFFLSKCVHVNILVSIWMSIPVIPLSLTLYTAQVIISFILKLFNLLSCIMGIQNPRVQSFTVHMDRIFVTKTLAELFQHFRCFYFLLKMWSKREMLLTFCSHSTLEFQVNRQPF